VIAAANEAVGQAWHDLYVAMAQVASFCNWALVPEDAEAD